MSFFLIRLLQRFSKFTLAKDAQPLDSLPPAEWSQTKGWKAKEKICPMVHLTMYVKVRYLIIQSFHAGRAKIILNCSRGVYG